MKETDKGIVWYRNETELQDIAFERNSIDRSFLHHYDLNPSLAL